MAFDNNQQDSALPVGTNNKRTSLDFLPKYFRTPTNQKFLNATVDQMINEGTVGKINSYIGRKDTPAYKATDSYLLDISAERQAYQLEPAIVSKDSLDNVTFFKDYNDYINQLNFFAGLTLDHSKVNEEEYYAWNPHIDWDKFVNYREYYWLPTGPQAVTVLGQSTNIESTYTVTLKSEVDNVAYIFSPDGLTANPTFKLYRGQTYNFEVDCLDRPIAFKTVRSTGNSDLYIDGITLFDENKNILPSSQHLKKGTIKFVVPMDAPNVLYYASESDINTSGFITIYDISDATEIDVDAEIVGKKSYITSDDVILSNGMKLKFDGLVTPAKYATGNWYVEGVGKAIYLIAEKDLETPAPYTASLEIEFDTENFDTQGFDINNNFPGTKDYITINRSSKDRNPWSRHNRWFHRSVIEASAEANKQPAVIDQDARAKRPIIEFTPNIQLWNFGKVSKENVTVVDTFTTDVFSTVEGSYGYNVDHIDLVEGMRVLFTADTDIRVAGRIFKVSFVTHLGQRRITLLPTEDTNPQEGETVLVTEGTTYRGSMFYYSNGEWNRAQDKTSINQSPLFDIFDPAGTSYGDLVTYPGTTFKGTKLFSYQPGTTADAELGFNITYRNVGNFGDIVFNFNLHTDKHTYQGTANSKLDINIQLGYLKVINTLTDTSYENGWVIASKQSSQYVVRQIDVNQVRNVFLIDAYEASGTLSDLEVKVYVNGVRQYDTKYTIRTINDRAYVQFFKDLSLNDVLVIKTRSSAPKVNGYYEFPFNLENNPQNLSVDTFTLGEINNHVSSIADNINGFTGVVPGVASLRDLGNITPLGTKVVQHSAPLLPIAYHITNKNYNIINALKKARLDYAKFKRNLLRKANEFGYDGLTRVHLDLILKEVVKDYTTSSPYYLSDMIPCSASFIFEQEVLDNSIVEYPLTFDFDLTTASEKAVLVYVNELLLVHGRDYVFVDTNFVKILSPITAGDNLKIVQYEKTDGCFLPPTPTKFGLYPKFEPKIFIDRTYQTPTKVIQGHDGSITVAFNDFRDDLLLEFETRIYNNIKVSYDPSLFDLYDYIPGYARTTDLSIADLNSVMASDFLHWSSLIADDYTKHTFFNRENPNTYNYKQFKTQDGAELPGFWRGIFKFFYDTDRPHTHPWEMLGMSVKPTWWETSYGPAPYTSNNLLLWQDLAEGLIKEPGKNVVKNEKFVRPFLLNSLPVDQEGNLNAPTDINVIDGYTSSLIQGEFTFGDNAPIEAAWRRSSEFPFSLLTALTILRPAKVFSSCFDRVRQHRDSTGQIVYKVANGNLRFNISNLVVPSTPDDSTRVFAAGLVNYVVDYIIGRQSLAEVDVYKKELSSIVSRLASKLGGFTTKEKFKLILDSRNPLNSGNVFIPEENYNIILNTSSPVASIDYSGVIVEKTTSGFIIRGYNKVLPAFKYFKPLVTNHDATLNVGGVSASYTDWASDQYYSKDKIVFYGNDYYRVSVAHQASTQFESKYFTKLSRLPLSGGRDIVIRTRFEEHVSILHYGAQLSSIQEVVDFLLGYGEYLTSTGLRFENFNNTIRNITDFQTSAKEFAFWTTQNWSAGSVISLSPCAEEIKFSQPYAVVDNIYDHFYEYSVLKQDGAALLPVHTSNIRENNLFTLQPKDTADGIYHATLNLVQKEHVLILDNTTIFNDVIYDQVQGYRQDRIKVVGYRTTDWQGDFDIPGFIYDRAVVKLWAPWTDYSLGDTVKYKEFYYSASTNVPGSETFEYSDWNKLDARPQPKLIPNWDYRANQFADFYDLDTDSFDLDQQKFAQHLIGYQKRQYLENIINDDVSQYKFYQGFITEKGTENSFAKLFDALSTSSKDSLEFYEEWAIRIGQYGATAGFDEVEFRLDESKFLLNPQPIELTKSVNANTLDFVYRILPDEVYLKGKGYNHQPFETKVLPSYYVSTAGYVCPEDVETTLTSLDKILSVNINLLEDGYYFWVGYDKNTWNVYRFTLFENSIRKASLNGKNIRFTLNRTVDTSIKVGSYIGINNTIPDLEGFHTVIATGLDYIEIVRPQSLNVADTVGYSVNLYKLVPVRVPSIEAINTLGISKKKSGDIVWVDNQDNNWEVWKYENNYVLNTVANSKASFGHNVVVDTKNTNLIVSIENSVLYYTRPSGKTVWEFKDELSPVTTQDTNNPKPALLLTNNTFGNSVSVRDDALYLAVGAPSANVSNVIAGNTSSNGNKITLSSGTTANFIRGGEIKFAPFTIGGIKANTTYYVKDILNTTQFTISATPNGDILPLDTRNGAMPVYVNHGYVVLYVRNNNGYYVYSNLVTAATVTNNQFFGHKVAVIGDKLFVASRGSSTVPSSLTAFYISKLVAGALDSTFNSSSAIAGSPITFALGLEILDMSVASNGNVIVSFNNGTTKIWNYSVVYNFNKEVQTLVSPYGNNVSYASAVSLTKDGSKLAIGIPKYSANHLNEGAVQVFYNQPDAFNSWTVSIPGLESDTSSDTLLTITTGVKTLTVRRGGTGLVMNVVASFGVLRSNPTIASAGTGYLVGDVVYITGGDGNASYKVSSVNSQGGVTAGVLLTKGTNYSSNPTAATLPKGLNILDLQKVTITKDLANYMVGVVESYNDATATLIVNVKEAYTPGKYVAAELLTNPYNRGSENFGSTVKFNSAGDQLVISSAGGSQRDATTFDIYSKHLAGAQSKYVNDPTSTPATSPTTFDLDATTFLEKDFGTGSVMLYDYYNNKFIYSDSLDVGQAVGTRYGEVVAVSDKIYISDANTSTGAVHEFASSKKSWYKFRTPTAPVNVNKIKSVFLYDIEDNSVITYLDIVDPLQGKILGIAEEELSFKTYYDPATYSDATTDQVVLDTLMSWKEKEIGQLWWDLSSAKFLDPNQGTALYKSNTWNNIFEDDLVDVYEWVQSDYSPAEWDKLADTEVGLTLGISGTSKYGDSAYSTSQTYDTVSKTFKKVYYFWVKNKSVVPNVQGRSVSAKDVASYISNPKNMGVSYIAFHDKNQFSLVNCKGFVTGKKVAINIRYWIIDNFEQTNIHSHYQLLSNSSLDKPINKHIEQKWIDSLCGFDSLGNEVPDPKIPVKLKYGIQNRPRQSMFVNRVEALKEFIERVNSVLSSRSIIDEYDLSNLNSKDEVPTVGSGKYDYEVSSYSQIRFVGTNDIVRAVLTPVVENGKIVRVVINVSGKGYVNPPEVVINGIGSGAKITTSLGANGQIISAIVEKSGTGYLASTTLSVRTLSVLVTSDETANNKWTLYTWNALKKSWFRERTQTYDTTRYWTYFDWYATGYNAFTKLDHILDFAYQLPSANINIGDIVKVKNQGIGGWVLLEKIDNQDVLETTVNFKTVGRENGTIKFTDNLYKFAANSAGFDGPTFDSYVYDDQPKQELRIILDTIKNNIFIDDLAVEYKDLFFASVRYAFTEQKFVDWAFKTSFVRSKHNLGTLEQKPTYQNDNLASYQEYINEAKPYRSKIREFVSTYELLEPTSSQVSDFDLPPRYDRTNNVVKTFQTKVTNGLLSYDSNDITTYPYSDWLYSTGFNLTSIEVVDGGEGYVTPPQVIIEQAPATISATAYLSSGKVTKIIISDPLGEKFLTTPVITLVGSISDTGRHATAVAILSNSLVRSTKVGIKFDRVSPSYTFTSLQAIEKFTGTGSKTRFELAWPIDIVNSRTSVSDSNGEVLGADYTVFNELDTSYSYTRYKGILQFGTAPANLSKIVVSYHKNIGLLDAADRINYFYNPGPGQLGTDLGQLMQGVDYGGVEITGIGFDVGSGWDALPWFTTGYDQFDPDFTDQLIKSDGVTRSFILNYAPTEIEYINVYWSGSRIFVTATPTATGNVDSTTLLVSNASGIKKGQTVTGVGVQSNTIVSDIAGAKVTLTKALTHQASGIYTFRTTESFNKRLDDPNYSDVKPLLDRLTTLENNYIVLQDQLKTAQADKDFNVELLLSITQQLDVVYELRAEAIANNASQETIDALTEQYDTLQQDGVDAENARDAAIALLATGNAQVAATKGTGTIQSVQIFDLFGRLIVPEGTYLKGQSISITGTLSHGDITGYVSGATYYIGEVINSTSVRITGTYEDAISNDPVFTVETTPGIITPGATVVIKGTINTLENEIASYPSIINTDAIMNSFVGDGVSTGPIVLPDSVEIQAGDFIILRKNTSDGSFKPSDIAYDTQIFGGDFAYVSATGIAAEDINIDGDGFVTPYSSHAPEEIVTGQVVDTVDITVYHKIGDGAPVIDTVRQTIVSDQTFYNIGIRPGTETSVIVKVGRDVIKQNVNYLVHFDLNQIELLTTYPEGSELVITSMGQNGLNILDLDYFIGDGSTKEFISVARWDSSYTTFVAVNGVPANVTSFKTDASYSLVGNIGIRFDSAPADGAVINYTVIGSAVDSISKIEKQTIVHDGSTSVYDLSKDPEFNKPLADNVLVIDASTGSVLRPNDSVVFIVSGTSRTYYVDSSRYAFNTVDSKFITVSVNGNNIVQGVDYFWFPVNNQLKVKKGVAKTGDKIILSISSNADYVIANNTIELFGSYSAGTTFTVVTFSNHDILEIERENDKVTSASTLAQGSAEYYRFNQLSGGRIKLRRPALGSDYVWIALNRKLLTPDVDYALEGNMNYVSFSPTMVFLEDDVLDIIAFSNNVTRSSFAYKIFKDMLNKNSYYRIDDASSTTLAKVLNFYDSSITVVDASVLPEPSAQGNNPGVVFIDGERIEYLRKEENVLRQLKRGTLGTGVKSVYNIGTMVRDQSLTQTVPYKDEFVTSVTVSDGYSTASTIYTNSANTTVTSIVFDGEDQTADITGSQVVTVNGTGFKINVKVFVGDIECVVNRISDTKLTFVTPAKSVGAYDLVIYNPAISSSPTATSIPLTGTVNSTSSITTVTLTGDSVVTGILRVGMTLNKVSGTGAFGGTATITEINNDTQITIKSTGANTYGNIVFTGTELVRTVVVPGIIATTGTTSTVTLTGTYVTSGLKVGQIISKVSGTGSFGSNAIILSIDSLTQFTVTATSNNVAGAVVFNINNQPTTSRVVPAGIKYLRIPLDFSLALPETDETWYRDTIPSNFNQCNDVEVFVAGRRLRKTPATVWDPSLGPDSPSGDVQFEAEFSVSSANVMQIRLTEVPSAGQYIVVQKRLGRSWTTEGVGLVDSGSEPAKFIRSTFALLPDKNKV